jgi:hypothetical protein
MLVTDILGLKTFLPDKFALWAGNVSCIEEILKSNKDIVFERIERFVPHNILSKYPDLKLKLKLNSMV